MTRSALLLALASLSLGACSVAPLDTTDNASDESTSSTAQPLYVYIANPSPTVIDFDTDPGRAAIADHTLVDATYASKGVTFTCVVCASGHAYARLPGRTGNGVSLFQSTYPGFDARFGAVRADFSSPRSFVSVDVLGVLPPEYAGTPVAKPWLQAFDAAGNLIQNATAYYPAYGTAGFGQWQTLRVDAPAGNIQYVLFSSQHYSDSPAVYGVFDNLTFNTDPYWADLTPIKKPIVNRIVPFPTLP